MVYLGRKGATVDYYIIVLRHNVVIYTHLNKCKTKLLNSDLVLFHSSRSPWTACSTVCALPVHQFWTNSECCKPYWYWVKLQVNFARLQMTTFLGEIGMSQVVYEFDHLQKYFYKIPYKSKSSPLLYITVMCSRLTDFQSPDCTRKPTVLLS